MIILETTETVTEVLNIGKSISLFFAKISFNNPGLSEWVSVTDDKVTFPTSRLNDFEGMCTNQNLSIEWR